MVDDLVQSVIEMAISDFRMKQRGLVEVAAKGDGDQSTDDTKVMAVAIIEGLSAAGYEISRKGEYSTDGRTGAAGY